MCTMHMPGACECQKEVSDSLEQDLRMVASHFVGAVKGT